jgi:hypothetical protein
MKKAATIGAVLAGIIGLVGAIVLLRAIAEGMGRAGDVGTIVLEVVIITLVLAVIGGLAGTAVAFVVRSLRRPN